MARWRGPDQASKLMSKLHEICFAAVTAQSASPIASVQPDHPEGVAATLEMWERCTAVSKVIDLIGDANL